jgi:hypothetical protein
VTCSITNGRITAATTAIALIVGFSSGAGCAANGDVVSKIVTIPAHNKQLNIWALNFSPDANQQFDANAVQFSPDGWTIAKDVRDEKSVRVVGLAFTPDSKFLLTANDMVHSFVSR